MKVVHYVDEGATHFVNVELDIWSRWPLDALAHAFSKPVSTHYVGREGRIYGAHFGPGFPRDADSGIRTFLRALSRLPRSAMMDWKRAHRREFNIGLQAGLRPHAPEFRVEAETLVAVAAVDASVVLTIYAPERSEANAPVGRKQPQNDQTQKARAAAGRRRR